MFARDDCHIAMVNPHAACLAAPNGLRASIDQLVKSSICGKSCMLCRV